MLKNIYLLILFYSLYGNIVQGIAMVQ